MQTEVEDLRTWEFKHPMFIGVVFCCIPIFLQLLLVKGLVVATKEKQQWKKKKTEIDKHFGKKKPTYTQLSEIL